jgi:hypothetical protein
MVVAIVIVEFKLLGTVIMKSYIRIIFVLAASFMAAHAFAQDLSGWSDKTVCRLVESDGGEVYIKEAQNRGLACGEAVDTTSKNIAKAFITAPVSIGVGAPQASINMYDRSITRNVFVSKNDGHADETVTFDFNNDGLLDVLMVSVKYLTKIGTPIEIALNNGDGTFSDGSSTIISGKIPAFLHSREIVENDFNGDSISDFYIIGHGYDAKPFPGEQNALLLSNGDGTWDNAPLPRMSDYTHSATSGDIDNDGDIDIYVGNIYGGKKILPYMLINNGVGEFTKNMRILPRALKSFDIQFTTSLLFDANDDGWLDIVVGGDGGRGTYNRVFLSKQGKFSNSSVIKLPRSTAFYSNIALDAQVYDFNNDDIQDILILSTNGKPFYVDNQIQILINTGASNFIDATDEYIPNYVHEDKWSKYVHIVDVNNDGYDDLLLESTGTYYLNDGTGVFKTYGAISTLQYRGLEVANMDSDAELEIVAADEKGFGLMDTAESKTVLLGSSAVGSTIFSEDFEIEGKLAIRVDERNNKWYIKQDGNGNSIYCNKATDNWTHFTFGRTDWSNYSISYRMKFLAGKGGQTETHIRKADRNDYRATIGSSGGVEIDFKQDRKNPDNLASDFVSTKTGEWLDIQLTASGDNIKYLVDGEVVASAIDDRLKKGSGLFAVSANSEVCIDDIVVNKM